VLRRFSINFAILSMVLDALWVALGLWISTLLRPFLEHFSFIQPIPEGVSLPISIYIVFPLIWVTILSAYAIYDGRRYFRAVDEFTTLTMASFIASIAMAGILYLSYRLVSRAMFLLFVFIVYVLLLGWRAIVRLIFRLRMDWPDVPRRVLIVGSGPLGLRVRKQLETAGVANMSRSSC
jgi:FlaA1/EpsC-like NDP-sugar epimerase